MMAAGQQYVVRGELKRHEPMKAHTSWRVGGPADTYFKPADRADLVAFLTQYGVGDSVLWLGLGSNLLVRDGGYRGQVIATHRALAGLERRSSNEVWAEAGVPCAKLAKRCAGWGVGPAEFFAGIPGTVGGALAMNAGAFDGETWRFVREVETVDANGLVRSRPAGDFKVSYRSVTAPTREWFVSATFVFEDVASDGGRAIRDLLVKRKASQPIGQPSCGSVFRNPPGDYAARLIEASGLKGLHVGGAQVSDLHANFIVNTGAASAADIEAVLVLVQSVVAQKFNVTLVPEVKIVGEFQ